jgi:tripartite-type tricarboxylate transporter receptor subunit TctC
MKHLTAGMLGFGFVAGMVFTALPAFAQAYPDKPINIIVPFPPGGADVYIRIPQQQAEKILGQPVVVHNRPGANGAVGTEAVRTAKPDGYTLLFNVTSSAVMNPLTMANVTYDIQKDFVPITDVIYTAVVMVARKDFPAKTLAEFIAYAKANPGKINYASPGPGSTTHLTAASLAKALGVPMTHVPYKGFVPANQALAAGEVDFGFTASAGVQSHVQSGALRAIAMAEGPAPNGYPQLPDLQKEVKGFENIPSFSALWAPAGTPRPIIEKLNSAFVEAMKSPDAQKKYAELGLAPAANSIADTEKAIANMVSIATRAVNEAKAAGVKFE